MCSLVTVCCSCFQQFMEGREEKGKMLSLYYNAKKNPFKSQTHRKPKIILCHHLNIINVCVLSHIYPLFIFLGVSWVSCRGGYTSLTHTLTNVQYLLPETEFVHDCTAFCGLVIKPEVSCLRSAYPKVNVDYVLANLYTSIPVTATLEKYPTLLSHPLHTAPLQCPPFWFFLWQICSALIWCLIWLKLQRTETFLWKCSLSLSLPLPHPLSPQCVSWINSLSFYFWVGFHWTDMPVCLCSILLVDIQALSTSLIKLLWARCLSFSINFCYARFC